MNSVAGGLGALSGKCSGPFWPHVATSSNKKAANKRTD